MGAARRLEERARSKSSAQVEVGALRPAFERLPLTFVPDVYPIGVFGNDGHGCRGG